MVPTFMLINELNNEKTFAINSKFVKFNINTTSIFTVNIDDKLQIIIIKIKTVKIPQAPMALILTTKRFHLVGQVK